MEPHRLLVGTIAPAVDWTLYFIIAKIVGWTPGTMAKMAARYGHFGIEELRGAVEAISSNVADGGFLKPGSLQFSLHSEANYGSHRAN